MAVLEDLAAELRQKLHDDPDILFKNQALMDRVVSACTNNGIEWSQIRRVLRDLRLIKEWEPRILSEKLERMGIAQLANPTSTHRSVLDVWRDAPVDEDAEVPPGFGFDDAQAGAIYLKVERKEDKMPVIKKMTVSYDPIVIKRRILHVDDGKIFLELAWRTGARWHTAIYPRESVFSSRDIVQTAADGAPVGSDNAADVVKYLRAYETHNRSSRDVGYATSSMGWKGDDDDPTCNGFMFGERQIGWDAEAPSARAFMLKAAGPGDRDDAKALRTRGTLEAWQKAVSELQSYPAFRLAIYAALASPLLPILDAPNAIIEWVGTTSTGKSRVLEMAQSCWRSANTKLPGWDNTISNFETKAHLFSGIPMILDDTKLVVKNMGAKGEEILAKAIYKYINGVGRGRDFRSGGQRSSLTWRSVLLSTGENPSSELAVAEGAAARVLSFWSSPFGRNNPKVGATLDRLVHVDLSENYGHAGPGVVKWLHEHRGEWQAIRVAYDRYTAKLRERYPTAAGARLARVVALLEVSATIGVMAGVIPWAAETLVDDPEIRTILTASIRQAETGADDARRVYDLVLSEAESRHSQWIDWGSEPKSEDEPSSGWLGWRSATMMGWLPSQLRKTLKAAECNPDAVLRAWRERGIMDVQEGRKDKSVRIGGGRDKRVVRLYCLRTPAGIQDAGVSWTDDGVDEPYDDEAPRLEPEIPFPSDADVPG